LLVTRDYVLYADALRTNSYDEVERHYTDIIRFQALQIAVDDNWSGIRATSDTELAHLEEYVRKFKDTRFKNRLKDAIREFHAFQGNTGDHLRRGAQEPLYETATFSVRQVPHFAEIRYGVHFNNTDESGLYTVFYGDRDDPYIGFYRSDAGFAKEINLDDIPIDEPV
jgi:hypothetical protein